MPESLAAVKTVATRTTAQDKPHLTPISNPQQQPLQTGGQKVATEREAAVVVPTATTPEDALQILRSQPDTDTLLSTLKKLRHGHFAAFSIDAPGPLQAQIINTLVGSIIPAFWTSLDESDCSTLLACLRSVAGIGALLAHARLLSDKSSRLKEASTIAEGLGSVLLAISSLIKGSDLVRVVWDGLSAAVIDFTRRRLAWKQFVALMGSGKVPSTVAQVEDVLYESTPSTRNRWLSNGSQYAAWLGSNIAHLSNSATLASDEAAAQLLTKAFGLAYPLPLIKGYFSAVLSQSNPVEILGATVALTPSLTRRQIIESSLHWLATIPTTDKMSATDGRLTPQITAMSALIAMLVLSHESIPEILIQTLTLPDICATLNPAVRRACMIALATTSPTELKQMLEALLAAFGDQLFINHSPSPQQESIAEVLILVAAYLHRTMPMAVLTLTRSSNHMQGVSNRLHSSHSRARWLGMIVSTALSSLVDKEGSKMEFGTDDMKTEEAQWFLALLNVCDSVGTISDFHQLLSSQVEPVKVQKKTVPGQKSVELPIIDGKQTFGPLRPVQTEVMGEKVSEILDNESDEDELMPYAKPDNDPEDSDEDATLVNRNKPRRPVYIRDLIRMLRDNERPDVFHLGIKNAATLMRRKANFGGEVKDHAEEIALLLCDLQDPFDTEGFDELKLQALKAVVLSDIDKMAPWLSKQAFAGEYSLSQRCIMLSALGLGGRELAGLKADDITLNPALSPTAASFPSKRLPDRLHAVYDSAAPSVKHLEATSSSVEHSLIKPLALSAADKVTEDLNAVKVRTFSSRLASDQQRTRRRLSPNLLARAFRESFFFPLVTRYQQEISAYGQRSVFASAPLVLVTFLKTIALLLHASGPATLDLPAITTVFWDLLLSLRVPAVADISILEAVLFCLLTLLEVNGESGGSQRLAETNPKHLIETQQWAELVFERTGGGDLVVEGSGEETRVRTLTAGVLVKTNEVIEAYQRLLVGYYPI